MDARIRTDEDVATHLAALLAKDARLVSVAAAVRHVPLRAIEPGWAGLTRVVMGQQLSTASAAAVWGRLGEAADASDIAAVAALGDAALRAAGLSRQKVRTVRAMAAAAANGLCIHAVGTAPVHEAREALTAVPGIGPWTADIYLMFAAGHPDLMPGGDLALRKAAARALGVAVPDAAALEALAQPWSPHRSVAARLLWAYYRVPDGPAVTPRRSAAVPANAAGFPL